MYQRQLRKERFYLLYQIEKTNRFITLDNTLSNKEKGNSIEEIEFSNNNNYLSKRTIGSSLTGRQNRVGKQENSNYPLVGIWGELPYLSEYRIVDPKGCFIYMEIKEQYIESPIREGTYLLKQIDENTFETVSQFPDGRLRLTVENEREIMLLPLFTLPDDEEGLLDPLLIYRFP
jgi:hypothetical protein